MLVRIMDNPEQALEQGAELLRAGKLVAFPTETVYGLGANAWDPEAVASIFLAKGRPADNPLIVHVASMAMVDELAREIPQHAKLLMQAFWPGPISLVLPRRPRVPDITTAGLDTVAIRWPNHPVATALIERAAVPIAAPSANRSGRPSPTTAQHVWDDLGRGVDLIIDAGMAAIGLESTVVDVSGPQPALLRPGAVTLEELRQVVGPLLVPPQLQEQASGEVRSPGMKYTHYAPRAPLHLYLGEEQAIVTAMALQAKQLTEQGERVGVLTFDEFLGSFPQLTVLSLGSRRDLSQAAARLYRLLRQFDEQQVDIILAQGVKSDAGIGMALLNRLSKASGYRLIWV